MKVSGQFCVNFKSVRISVIFNIFTTVEFYHFLSYLTTACSPQDLPSFYIYMHIIAVYSSAFR